MAISVPLRILPFRIPPGFFFFCNICICLLFFIYYISIFPLATTVAHIPVRNPWPPYLSINIFIKAASNFLSLIKRRGRFLENPLSPGRPVNDNFARLPVRGRKQRDAVVRIKVDNTAARAPDNNGKICRQYNYVKIILPSGKLFLFLLLLFSFFQSSSGG